MVEESASEGSRYCIDLEGAAERGRSIAVIVAARKCYEHRSIADSIADSDPAEHIEQIAAHCADTADYLLQDTPLKEAIFRLFLAGGNEPMTVAEVSQGLDARWAMSAYPRDISPGVVGRLLDHSPGYGIAAIPEPEPQPEAPTEIGPPTAELPEDGTGEGDNQVAQDAPGDVGDEESAQEVEDSGESSDGDSG